MPRPDPPGPAPDLVDDDPGRDHYRVSVAFKVERLTAAGQPGEVILDMPASWSGIDDSGLTAIECLIHDFHGHLISIGALKGLLKGQIKDRAKLAYLGMVAKSGPCAPGDVVGEPEG